MKIGPREQLIIVIVGLLIVLLAVGAILVWPQYQKQKALDEQTAAANAQLKAANDLVVQRQQVKNRASVTDSAWLRLASLVPENPDLPSLIIDLQDAAFSSGTQIIAVVPADPVESADKSYVIIPMEVRVLGTWADTIDYLKGLDKLNRGLRVVSFTSSLADPAAGEPVLPNYSELTAIQLQAYMIPASSGATSTPAAAPATP